VCVYVARCVCHGVCVTLRVCVCGWTTLKLIGRYRKNFRAVLNKSTKLINTALLLCVSTTAAALPYFYLFHMVLIVKNTIFATII